MENNFYVYKFLDCNNTIIYVGKTSNMTQRMKKHFGEWGHLPKECYDMVRKIEFCKLNTHTDMTIFEIYMINKYNPKYNTGTKYNESNDSFQYQLLEPIWEEYKKSFSNIKKEHYQGCSIKSVICITTNKKFKSINEARRYYNIKSKSGIRDVCIGKLKSCGKDNITGKRLIWKYCDGYTNNTLNIIHDTGYKIICLNNKMIFYSLEEAKKYFHLNNVTRISECLHNKSKFGGEDYRTHEKLQWMFYNDYLQL